MEITVGLLAALNHVGRDSILRAERRGIIPPAMRTPGGYRRWRIDDLEKIRDALRARRQKTAGQRPGTAG